MTAWVQASKSAGNHHTLAGSSNMEGSLHSMTNLFNQLGLPSGPADIEAFIAAHRPLPEGLELAEAPFWTASQAGLLREEILQDADWVGVIDRLDSGLRLPKADGTGPVV
jgi:hypothetical protein